jgi:preprotein translocase subunit SecA
VKLPELPDGTDERELSYVSSESSSPRAFSGAGGAQTTTSGDADVRRTEEGRTIRQVQVGGQHTSEKVGRNDPCPCGSGKKYKKCHGA